MNRYTVTRVGTHNITVAQLNNDVPTPGELVAEACASLTIALDNYPSPWEDYLQGLKASRSQLASALRSARSQNWRFRKSTHLSNRAEHPRQVTLQALANQQDKPETWPEYLRRLADDCEDSGNNGHAADHRTSAAIIDRLVAVTRSLVFELTNFCHRNDITVEPDMQAQLDAARAACDITNTTQSASDATAA